MCVDVDVVDCVQGLMATILGLQPRTTGGGGEKSSDETVLDIAKEIAEQVGIQTNKQK